MRKRTRKLALILLLLPILLIVWTVGWALVWAGDQSPQPVQTARKDRTKRKDNVHITVNLPQEEQEITT